MDIPPKEDLVLNDACNTQNMSLATDCDLITFDLGDQIRTTIPSAKDLNKSEELSSKVEEVLRSMESMRVVNMARDEQIDKILESVSRIETMISQLSLNNDFETPTKLSVQKTRPLSNRLKAKSSDIDIHTTISDDEDDLIELDKRSFIHDDAFKIEINIDNPSMHCKFMSTPTMHLLEDQIKACAYAFSASLDPLEELVVTDTIRATRSDFEHFIPDRPITDKILELAALRCTDDQSDVSFKTMWQLSPRFVANVLEQVIKLNFYKDDGI
ncbi:Ulp1 protease family, carboxy-terminal domain protein [Arachis hypogaea]|nr:Ulp1 protease family, carboxy-terminal domain protein [Arachis hypogaea]